MIIDAHAHLVAPSSLYGHKAYLISAAGQFGDPYRAKIIDSDLEKSASSNIAIMDEVGTDIQLLSPRPFLMMNGAARWEDIVSWTFDQNDTIARTIKFYPDRFRGVAALPQQSGRPVESLFDEIDRAIGDLGFVGVLINPDPSEGAGTSPPLGDSYWYPLYERMCELDLPGHVHSGNCCNGRETYDEHFIAEESLAITSVYKAGVFERFPDLKLMISHGGGAIPYQVGRWRSHREMARAARRVSKDAPSFDDVLKRFWFDTVVHNEKSLELLFDVVGPDRCCFGTERPGSGGGVDPETGRPYDDLKPVIENISSLTEADRQAIFHDNAMCLFGRLNS